MPLLKRGAYVCVIAVMAAFSVTALADGTEQLGNPVGIEIAVGTGVVVAGVGMQDYPNLPNSFTVTVPTATTVKQVLLYWSGHWTNGNFQEPGFVPQIDGDNVISVNGISVQGQKIGGSTLFFNPEEFITYRADITGLSLVAHGGQSTLTISDMFFQSICCPIGSGFDHGNDGVGVLVIYDDGGAPAHLDVRDGLDLAFAFFNPPLDTSVSQMFTFAPSAQDRSANLATLASSVSSDADAGPRPNELRISFAPGGQTLVLSAPWQSNDGHQFDALNSTITVPAGASSMTVQAISGPAEAGGSPASLAWIGATLSISGENLPASLGDFVWNDSNQNGIQDAGEPGIGGVTVRLRDCTGAMLATTTTDASGLYLFSELAPGAYSVEFVRPVGSVFSPPNQGADDTKDSDANTSTGVTGCYALLAGENNLTVDAGMYIPQRWADETAVGAGTRYPGTSNWFMYSPYSTAKIDLIAGQRYDAGDIFMSRNGSTTTITIVLHPGWRWADMEENLKIQPFANAPTSYLEPGAFQYKFEVSGSSVSVTIPGTSAKFYGIHGDVQRLLPQ